MVTPVNGTISTSSTVRDYAATGEVYKITNAGLLPKGGNLESSFVKNPVMGMTDGTNDAGGIEGHDSDAGADSMNNDKSFGGTGGPIWMTDTFGVYVSENGDSINVVGGYSGVRVE